MVPKMAIPKQSVTSEAYILLRGWAVLLATYVAVARHPMQLAKDPKPQNPKGFEV